MRILTTLAALTLATQAALAAETKTYEVTGMHCGSCAEMISAKVCKLPNIEACKVEVGRMVLTGKEKLNDEEIQKSLESVGEYKIAKVSSGDVPATKPQDDHKHHGDAKSSKKTKKAKTTTH